MKKVYFTIFVILGLCGCIREELGDYTEQRQSHRKVPVSYVAMAPYISADVETRTMLNDDHSVSWHVDDAVAFVSSGTPSKLTNIFSDGSVAVFEGFVPEVFLKEPKQFFIYPYSEPENGAEGLKLKRVTYWGETYGVENIVIPKVQELVCGTFGKGDNVSAAVMEPDKGRQMQFKNLCGLFSLDLKGNADVKRVLISANDDISGTIRIEYQDSEEKFRILKQYNPNGNPYSDRMIVLESEEGVSLTESPQSFYGSAFSYSDKTYKPPFGVVITTVDGKVFWHEIKETSEELTAGKIVHLGEFEVNGLPFSATSFSCDSKAHEIQVSKTRYLDYDYELRWTEPWMEAVKTTDGFTLIVEANASGRVRTAEVDVISAGKMVATVTVSQNPFSYRDLLGRYLLYDGTLRWVLYFKEDESGQEDHYVVEATIQGDTEMSGYRPKFIVNYNESGESLLTMTLPQTMEDYQGGKVELVPLSGIYETPCTGEGLGYDLVYSEFEDRICFDMVPNALSAGIYADIGRLAVMVDGKVMEKLGSSGQNLSIMSIPNSFGGGHEGLKPKL